MFGVSLTELIVIAVVTLIVFGPEKLPELMHSIGRVLGFLQKEYDAVRKEFFNSVYTPANDTRQRLDSAARELLTVAKSDKEDPKEVKGKEEGKTADGG